MNDVKRTDGKGFPFLELPLDGPIYENIIKFNTGREIDHLCQASSSFRRWFHDWFYKKMNTDLRLPQGIPLGIAYRVYHTITQWEKLESGESGFKDTFFRDQDITTMAVWMKGIETLSLGSHIDRIELMKSAAKGGHLAVIKFLLKDGFIIDTEETNNLKDLLLRATEGGHLQILEFFLENGFEIDHPDTRIELLTLAIRKGHFPIIQLLLNGFQIDLDDRIFLLKEAAEMGDIPVMQLLLQDGFQIDSQSRVSILKAAARGGQIHVLQFVVKDRFEIDSQGRVNIMRVAAKSGHIEVLQFLLQEECFKISRFDSEYLFIMQEAIKEGHTHVVQFLLQNGFRIVPVYQIFIMKAAIKHGNLSAIQFLFQLEGFQISNKDLLKMINQIVLCGDLSILNFFLRLNGKLSSKKLREILNCISRMEEKLNKLNAKIKKKKEQNRRVEKSLTDKLERLTTFLEGIYPLLDKFIDDTVSNSSSNRD